MNSFESIVYWLATLLLAATFMTGLAAVIFKKVRLYKVGLLLSAGALSLITIWGIARWVNSGHPPFVTRFESMLTSVWFILLIFHILRYKLSQFQFALNPISLSAFLLMGWAATIDPASSALSESLNNTWLFIHASFATAGAATFLIAAALSVIYILGDEWINKTGKITERLPNYDSLPRVILNFCLLGMILWGVMIVSGSIWANAAWGRYWAWDPIELWSLISWLFYGFILHLRLAFKLSHRKFSWLVIIASGAVVFSLWGIGYFYNTIHSYG